MGGVGSAENPQPPPVERNIDVNVKDCSAHCLSYADFVFSVELESVKRDAVEALRVARKAALQEMREQDSVRNSVQQFENDPQYLKLDALARNRALLSFHEQLEKQLSQSLRPWEKEYVAHFVKERQEPLYEARAGKMAHCMRVCEGWEGLPKVACMLRAVERKDLAAAGDCLLETPGS